MLEDLLELLSKDGLLSTAQIARRLDVSPLLVEPMLADLVRAGYLQEAGRNSQAGACTACSGCGPHATCATPRQWMRTTKILNR